ncbi:positive regulator for alginate biosynthesis MucC [Microbulbifer sp. A4B17]|uniref:SoxR reducing system RseC family protein n=1 Tax=Microbulbifer sp. A4B17 TaxID=359370 RepID=UPI000D52B213|nr:SoxR reducing system RseC family protein [Microbulbifer sp. A4B17]AWF82118.1 positive regulator for alginate biosynthesis MucC [Microbulbifer sp. A4B17]
MLQERGRVVAIESDAIWVETTQSSACNGCSTKSSCGTGLLGDLFSSSTRIKVALNGFPSDKIHLDDIAVIGITENALTSSALLVYLVPLVSLVLAALIGDSLFAELGAVIGALIGLVVGALGVRWYSRYQSGNPTYTPVLLQIEPSQK